MHMPSNIPVYDSVQLAQFDALEHQYVDRPTGTALRAWDKLDELERRLDAFDWACMVVREPRRCDTFINDLAFAFVLGLEATIQVLRHERGTVGFDAWLSSLAAYDMPCRALRTIRNLEAHVRSSQMLSGHGRGVYSRFTSSMTPQPGIAWRFPQLSLTEYNSLKPHGRKLSPHEIPDWNAHAAAEYAANIMRGALISAVSIVKQA